VAAGTLIQAVSNFGTRGLTYPVSNSANIAAVCVVKSGYTLTTYFRAAAPGPAVISSHTVGCGSCAQLNLSANVVVVVVGPGDTASSRDLRSLPETDNSTEMRTGHRFGQGLNKTTMVALQAQLSHLRPEVGRLERARYQHGRAAGQHRGEATDERSSLTSGRPPQRRVTAGLLSDLIRGYEGGETTYQLADKHGLNRNTVAAHLRSAGVSIRIDPMTPAQIEYSTQLYAEGWSLAKIGCELGADAETVRKRLREVGVVMRSPQAR